MSSHHVIREKQEPALLVLGLDHFADELLGQLLEWSPTVITTPRTAEKLIALGIKIDWIISNDEDITWQADVKLMSGSGANPADAALKYLAGNGYSAVNIITDELSLENFGRFAAEINLVIFYENKKIYAVNPGFSKWKAAGEVIAVLTRGSDLHVTGLTPINEDQYRTMQDGFFSISFSDPLLFIAEDI